MTSLEIQTPRWAIPILSKTGVRYRGAKGGRASGKSHLFAEMLVERILLDPSTRAVCIREVQKDLKHSAKLLIQDKINAMGLSHLFDIQVSEIKSRVGNGFIMFQGMQEHTAESVKSLEAFNIAWVEEAQSVSKRSIDLLDPTIRVKGSELWFTWNPRRPDDAVEELFRDNEKAICTHVNYTDNPFVPQDMIDLAERAKKIDYEGYKHIWLGAFQERNDAQVFKDAWEVRDFEVGPDWDGPYQGGDFGYVDPTAIVQCYVHDGCLFVRHAHAKSYMDLDDIAQWSMSKIPDFAKEITMWDSSRPDSIALLCKNGLPRSKPVVKRKGSVEDGITHMRSYNKIIIHSHDARDMADEMMMYSRKVDKRSGNIMDEIEDRYNHTIDACRYALQPIIDKAEFPDWSVICY